MILDIGIICPNCRIGCPNCVVRFVRVLCLDAHREKIDLEAADGVATAKVRRNSRSLPFARPGDHFASELPQTHPRKKVREFQRCVFKTAANRAAPVREAVISVPTRSRSRTR
jgi:hypothetical protein